MEYGFTPPLSGRGIQASDEGREITAGDAKEADHASHAQNAEKTFTARRSDESAEQKRSDHGLGNTALLPRGRINRLQVCNFLPGYDRQFSRRCRWAAAFRIRKRKQDQLRRVLYYRLLQGSTLGLCTIWRITEMMEY